MAAASTSVIAPSEEALSLIDVASDKLTNPDQHEAEIAKHHNDWTRDTDGEAYLQRLVEARGGDPTADLRSAGRQLEARTPGLHRRRPRTRKSRIRSLRKRAVRTNIVE